MERINKKRSSKYWREQTYKRFRGEISQEELDEDIKKDTETVYEPEPLDTKQRQAGEQLDENELDKLLREGE